MASISVRLWAPLAFAVVSIVCVASARADIAAPDPKTVFGRGQEPSSNTIVAAGAAISAVIIAAGLIVIRWPVRTSTGRMVVTGIAGAAILAVWGVACGSYLQAERDRGLWKQWEINESNRRANWRGPPRPDLEGPPLPAPSQGEPAPASSEPTPPTIAAESVQ